jgi:hypothetical protein
MNFKNKKYLFGLIPIFISLLSGIFSTVSANSDNSQMTPTSVTAAVYAKHYGVTIDEALHRLTLQDSFPGLPTALENNEKATFGGIWIQHEPEYKIVVAFTENGQQTISKYSKYISKEATAYIETRVVSKSLVELKNDQDKLLKYLNNQGLQLVSRVDIINNCVSIDIAKSDKDKFTLAIQNDKSAIPDGLIINFVDGLPIPQTDIYGGLLLLTPVVPPWYGVGTSGFAVKNVVTNIKGIATAGHITTPISNTLYYNWTSLPYQTGYYGGAFDWQWRTCPGLTVTNKIQWWYNGWTFDVNSKKTYYEQVIGDVVSKYGNTTHYTCGQITNTMATLLAPLNVPTWIEVTNIYGYAKLSDGGDSGGPWFTGNGAGVAALGIHSSGTTDGQKAYYMAQNLIELWGVSVMTSP